MAFGKDCKEIGVRSSMGKVRAALLQGNGGELFCDAEAQTHGQQGLQDAHRGTLGKLCLNWSLVQPGQAPFKP